MKWCLHQPNPSKGCLQRCQSADLFGVASSLQFGEAFNEFGRVSGHFDFPVGPEYVVRIDYCVNWLNLKVLKIDLTLSSLGELSEIAEHAMNLKFPIFFDTE